MKSEIQEIYGNFTFLVDSRTKILVRAFVKHIDTDISKWVRSLVREYLIENKVLNASGELINGWGDPSTVRQRECPRGDIELTERIGVGIDLKSSIYIGLYHYSSGNSIHGDNMSEVLRFLVERGLRREEVITKSGEITAKWSARLERINLNQAA